MLTFTAEQVFWTCQQAYWCEETSLEVDNVRFEHFYPSIHPSTQKRLYGKMMPHKTLGRHTLR